MGESIVISPKVAWLRDMKLDDEIGRWMARRHFVNGEIQPGLKIPRY